MAVGDYGILSDGRLMVTCWCEKTSVLVTSAELKAGLTKPCKNGKCRPPA